MVISHHMLPTKPHLNFINCHLRKCSTATKASAYLLLVHPLMEYAAIQALLCDSEDSMKFKFMMLVPALH